MHPAQFNQKHEKNRRVQIVLKNGLKHDFFHNLLSYNHLAIAVSGGSDSLALLLLLKNWVDEHHKELTVLTVNHGLRKESAQEAQYVSDLCKTLNLKHRVLKWQSEKPVSALQQQAREARYDLLARFCVEKKIPALVLGHTKGDQAETVLMRLRRARHHNRGLAGMAEKTLYQLNDKQSVFLMRPLLKLSRAALRDYLLQRGIVWVDDPSNDDVCFERVRLRSILKNEAGLNENICDFAALTGRYRAVLNKDASHFLSHSCHFLNSGVIKLEKPTFLRFPQPVKILVLQVLICILGGQKYFQPSSKILNRINNQENTTLGGVFLFFSREAIILVREMRNLPLPKLIQKQSIIWDGRYLIDFDDFSLKLDIFSGLDVMKQFPEDSEQFFKNNCRKLRGYEKQGFSTMPWGRIYDTDSIAKAFYPLPYMHYDALKVRCSLGPFERYCASFDEMLCMEVQRLFSFSKLK